MARQSDVKERVEPLLAKGTTITKVDHLAKLWKGYGSISRIHLDTSKCKEADLNQTYIVKMVKTQKEQDLAYDEDHARKVLSYSVEANFYRGFQVNNRVDQLFIPDYFAVDVLETKDFLHIVLVLEDLDVLFPVMTEKRETLNDAQVTKALDWLANFHASSWSSLGALGIDALGKLESFCPTPRNAIDIAWRGDGLWKQGGYHYLSTRMKELESIKLNSRWGKLGLHADSELPFAVDWCLNNPTDRNRISLVHGDVKAANMAFDGEDADSMVMYDFQYVGLGLGVQDLAKFLTTSIPESYLDSPDGEQKLLKQYHTFLLAKESEVAVKYEYDALMKDWELALVNWVRFLAGWSGGFWGNVDWLQNRVEGLLKDKEWVDGVVKRWKEGTEEPGTSKRRRTSK
ncbi:Protein of unknown function DUF227 [Kalmanozyma brasiliensis GHG001]|uniref:CHK kinase-like domain-containing protein n=1 Tax=Kalmanozyma brasiliensis (strain GHG001) TaxID=1365824 RepID=V5EV86_KALBG|nr:Protein of unknown function DUF227 [Kalmanozyma brasiliensis GHG001]EST09375.1 Protein of unknown function DUF227 [Kalmanozyma brasiliensis GHG001]